METRVGVGVVVRREDGRVLVGRRLAEPGRLLARASAASKRKPRPGDQLRPMEPQPEAEAAIVIRARDAARQAIALGQPQEFIAPGVGKTMCELWVHTGPRDPPPV